MPGNPKWAGLLRRDARGEMDRDKWAKVVGQRQAGQRGVQQLQ